MDSFIVPALIFSTPKCGEDASFVTVFIDASHFNVHLEHITAVTARLKLL
ncbi:hypothetical protein Htur_4605 (plasmid) [Haloterrigena turkmenica DSM 5511]|uniref:Uncharacterized protein n=1 Tax=Haloterrigena turkmenica (strain ATCC 51198 / DSM 5511 / JCM 9101 / NCIMB 13204 / VKM B-1734 / 4k) TaxID=543526 RepID=D2S1Z6_HALTV|nr:hypothetical protein Htur_4605 [Haloterrigena turkmenica DSM 5511]